MNSGAVFQSLKRILTLTFPWLTNTDQILPQHRLREDLELDSLAMVNLQVAVEDKFDIHFDPIETDLTDVFETVGSLGDFIENQLAEKQKNTES